MTGTDPLAVGHPLRFSTIAHAERTILGPASAGELERVLDAARVRSGGRGVDIGCGKGDLLVRLALRGTGGLGIDRNPAFLADARALAAAAGVADRVAFREADAAGLEVDGEYDVVACVGATGALGGPAEAPARLRALARDGGVVIIGEGFWRREPTPAQLEDFGVAPGEMLDREGTLTRMTAGGLTLVAAVDASLDGWNAYEDAYAGAVERWAAAHPDDPERAGFLERAAWFRSTWAAWRREAMGFVTAVLRRA